MSASAGSSTVTGTGSPNLGPTCIVIRDCDGDGICGPGGSNDDVQIGGPSGTDPTGNFTITVSPALTCHEKIYAQDLCNDLMGPVQLVHCPAPVPALSRSLMVVLAGTLGLIGLAALSRTRRIW